MLKLKVVPFHRILSSLAASQKTIVTVVSGHSLTVFFGGKDPSFKALKVRSVQKAIHVRLAGTS